MKQLHIHKILLSIITLIVVSLCVSACTSSGEQVVAREAFVSALDLVSNPEYFAANCLDATTAEALQNYGIDAVEFSSKVLENMSYELGEVEVASDKATATLTLSSRNIHAAMDAAASRFLALSFEEQQAIYEALESAANTDDEAADDADEQSSEPATSDEMKLVLGQQALLSELIGYFYEELDVGADNLVVRELELVCKKDSEGTWQLNLEDNPELVEAILA